MVPQKKATDAELMESYNSTKSVWETGRRFGMCGQSVHERLVKLGVKLEGNGKPWTIEDDKRLAEEYELYRYFGQVSRLGESMGHNVYFLSRKAKELGLTSLAHRKAPRSSLKKLSEDAIKMVWEDYRVSTFKITEYCRRHGFDDEAFANTMKDRFPEYDDVMEGKKTKSTHYASGRTFEYRAKNFLQAKGFFVMRAPQSKGPADLIAYNKGRCLLIQCKIGDWHQIDAWNEFYRVCIKHGAEPIYCTKKEEGRMIFYLITGEKDKSRRAMPMTEIKIEEYQKDGEGPGVQVKVEAV